MQYPEFGSKHIRNNGKVRGKHSSHLCRLCSSVYGCWNRPPKILRWSQSLVVWKCMLKTWVKDRAISFWSKGWYDIGLILTRKARLRCLNLLKSRSFYSPAWYAAYRRTTPYASSMFSFVYSVGDGWKSWISGDGRLALGLPWWIGSHGERHPKGAYRLTAQFGGHGVATRLPGLLGLFISILRHSTFTWRNHCHRRQGAARPEMKPSAMTPH